MAYAGKDDNDSQFFFTLGSHQICRIKIQSLNDRSLHPSRLIKTIILNNPFANIPRIIVQEGEEAKDSSKTKTAVVKYFNLLSFVEKAEENEDESVILNKQFSGKRKSAHDHLTDPKLSSQPAVELLALRNKERKEDRSSDWESNDEVKTPEELESNEEKDKKYIERYKKGTEESPKL
ncbi:Peptidyl-prolyl cis-trans isomerase CWC27 like protein [Eufriesea mexicana]|uniref:Peptidyl-prolyl cis-trans isomerase CWC27 like protein n=1 Tax=Eufriesea mexicana TaxID=516756 RepID=A0A310SNG2_9HYME|nr:Peptidyl-prolyl cis-trans isomerase CWC27 like protein [Eufriesea mexicana]